MDNLKMGAELPKEEEFALAAYGPESIVSGYYFPAYFLKNLEENVIFKNNPSAGINW